MGVAVDGVHHLIVLQGPLQLIDLSGDGRVIEPLHHPGAMQSMLMPHEVWNERAATPLVAVWGPSIVTLLELYYIM